ncbi:hypothetical protein GCM10027275_03810 [Rhabdobacter roseus]|uniref:Lipoprotein n=1 Tax=Rhabdobacter roseus TaxID=1655419 RepID=A0A840TQE4_9BACT|nr:hypothetical protein [Rhabdobacter roseus]MBB5282270.1 hypothetical protein [Rhabdobacter roseus]
MKQSSGTFLLLVFLLGCNVENRVGNSKELVQEMKDSQIKRITNAQLISLIDEWGKQIVKVSQKALGEAVSKQPGNASRLCQNLDQVPLIGALEQEYGVDISLLGLADVSNPALEAKERELLEAYAYNAGSTLPASDNIQKLNDTLYVYNASLPLDSPIATECFGEQKVPFAVWRVLFDKKEVVRKIDVKRLK